MAAILHFFKWPHILIFFNRWRTIVGENFMLVAKMAQFTPKYAPNCWNKDFQLPETDRPARRAWSRRRVNVVHESERSMWYTVASSIALCWQHLRRSRCRDEFFPSPFLWQRSRGKCPYFRDRRIFFIVQKEIEWNLYAKQLVWSVQLPRQKFRTSIWYTRTNAGLQQ